MDNTIHEAVIVGGRTMIHPLGLTLLILCSLVISFFKKYWVLPAITVFIFVIPYAQRILIFELDFSFFRIAILLALIRAKINGDFHQLSLSKPDKLILIWALWCVISYGFLYESFSASITRIGYMIDAVGAYFVGRIYANSWNNVKKALMFVSYFSVPILGLFIVEHFTSRNLFSVFGGISEYTLIRDENVRCQGPFYHPIMAGLFWATILPWIAALRVRNEISSSFAILTSLSTSLIVLSTASSTSVMALLLCAIGLIFFPYKKLLPSIRLLAIFIIAAAQLVLEKGAAHLLARINIFGGSTGWHRYYLINKSFEHINEWWLIGTTSTHHWGRGLSDVTNQYILEGVRSGLIGAIIFILFLISLFGLIGKAIDKCHTNNDAWLLWAGGVALFIHTASFFSVSYFGQMVGYFYLFSGITTTLSISYLNDIKKEEEKYK